jgi:hypothetical protein
VQAQAQQQRRQQQWRQQQLERASTTSMKMIRKMTAKRLTNPLLLLVAITVLKPRAWNPCTAQGLAVMGGWEAC